MPLLTAAARSFRLNTKLKGHDLRVRSFTGEEGVSRLFRFRVLVDADSFIPTPQLLGQHVTFVIELRPKPEMKILPVNPVAPWARKLPGAVMKPERTFLAMIAAVDELGPDEHDRVLYALELVPRLWSMTQTVRSRVFENLDPLGIIDQVFEGSGIRIHAETRSDDAVRPYCVQYFETDFDFVVRLLEEEGYIYQYEAAGDQPIFAIRHFPSSFHRLGKLPFHDVAGGPEERIVSWKKTRILTATSVSARDHFFQAASPLLEGEAGVPESNPATPGWEPLDAPWSASIDRYPGQWAHLFEELSMNSAADGPNGYMGFGGKRTRYDLQQVTGSTSASEGAGNCPHVAPGCIFELGNHPAAAGEHFVVSVHHKGSQALDHTTLGTHSFTYENTFIAVPYATSPSPMMYLPPRSTRKPVIYGCQTAVVVGAPGADEIWTDKYGRVQVQFWWDRAGTNSCWVRVATPWAGSGWGMQHIPRVGQEVVVTFLDGDPDRPLIVGSVYNPSNMPPFPLPENKTQSGIRTHSTTGGKAGESNEICFEDARGAEEIYLHAQKDRTEVVRDESREVVGGDRYNVVENDFHAMTNGEKREAVAGKSSLAVGGDCMNASGANYGIAAKEIHLKAGKIVIEAEAISLRTGSDGGEFICLNSDGITIDSKGKEVWLNCGGTKKPDTGCYKAPDMPEERFKSTNPKDAGFGGLKDPDTSEK